MLDQMKPTMVTLVLLALLTACAAEGDADSTIAIATSVPADATSTTPTTAPSTVDPVSELPDLGPVPPLENLDGWLQSDIETLQELRGQVVVVQFWTFGCHNCKATLPNLQSLYTSHAGDGFEIVGVHSPEFDYERDPEAVRAAASDLGVSWPIALDGEKKNFFSWQGSPAYWPRTYVIDRDGRIRFDHIGEGAYEELNETVDLLLG
jgi:thiol-disulfide isomerase/thioredoxin